MIGTALDHLEAAEPSSAQILAPQSSVPAARVGPVLWHAPEQGPQKSAPAQPSVASIPADVHPCTGCGFPISGVRTKCVDCDAHWEEQQPAPIPLAEMFRVEKEESWVEAHGYTIATALVSALTAAIIYWLR